MPRRSKPSGATCYEPPRPPPCSVLALRPRAIINRRAQSGVGAGKSAVLTRQALQKAVCEEGVIKRGREHHSMPAMKPMALRATPPAVLATTRSGLPHARCSARFCPGGAAAWSPNAAEDKPGRSVLARGGERGRSLVRSSHRSPRAAALAEDEDDDLRHASALSPS